MNGNRRRVFGSLGLLVFLVNFGRVVFAPLVDVFMRVFEVGEATVGVVVTVLWLGSAVPRLPTGYLLTRVPRHRVVAGTGVFLAGASALTAAAPTVEWVAVGAFLIGVASGVYYIAANPLVSELFPDRVGRALGLHATAAQLAAVLAPAVVGATLSVGWRAVFVGLGGVALLGTGGLLVATRGADLPTAGATDRDLPAAVRSQWPLVATGVALLGTAGFVWNGVFNFYVPYLTAREVPPGTARTLLTAVFAAGVPAMVVTGRLADSVRPRSLVLAVLGGFATTLVALTYVDGILALAAVSLLLGYAVHGLFPAVDTYMLAALPDEHRGSAYAAFSAVVMLVGATGSAVLGGLVGAGVAYDDAFRGGAVVVVAVAAVMLVLDRAGRLP